MRVTQQMRMAHGLLALQENQHNMEKLRLQIATGRKILEAQDDPQGVERSLVTRSYLGVVRGVLRNLDTSEDWMDASASALQQFAKVLNSARVRALQGINETQGPDERRAIAVEIREALSQAVDAANSDERGQYLFGGFQINQKPFVLDEATLQVTYTGDDGAIRHEIEPGRTVQVNVTGAPPSGGGQSVFAAGFEAIAKLYNGLMADDTSVIREAIDGLDGAAGGAMDHAAVMGARARALDDARTRLSKFELDLQSRIANIENVDVAEAAVQLGAAEQQHQATLVNLSQNLFQSLFDFLR